MNRLHRCIRLPALLLAAFAAGCGSGGLNTGIDGTGIHSRDIVSFGRVRAQQALSVNGLTYDTARASVLIDGRVGTMADVKEGDVALVEGSVETVSGLAGATRVSVDHMVQGVVTAVSAQSLEVLGQTVDVDAECTFDSALPERLASVRVGDALSISGFRDASGHVIATRIARHSSTVSARTTGAMTGLVGGQPQLRINGLLVDYATATMAPADIVTQLKPGTFLEVAGEWRQGSGMLIATTLQLARQRLPGSADSSARIEGYVTRLASATGTQFELDGIPVATSAATTVTGTLSVGARLDVSGSISTAGALLASTVRSSFTPPTVPTVQLTGRVVEAGLRPVADADINMWIQAPGFGYSYAWATHGGTPKSDAQGTFRVSAAVGWQILVNVSKAGYVQPCTSLITVAADESFDVEIVPLTTLNALNPPAPMRAATTPVLSGQVYELVAGQRRPVAGASLWVGDSMGLTYAGTVSDAGGGYLLCNLPERGVGGFGKELWVQKPGYEDRVFDAFLGQFPPVPGTLDVEMRRKP